MQVIPQPPYSRNIIFAIFLHVYFKLQNQTKQEA